jgi:hypothetical protein
MAYSRTARPQTSGSIIPLLIAPQTASITPIVVSLKCCRCYIYALI